MIRQSPTKFLLVLLALSLPFWLLGIFAPNSLMPFGLPISALMFICPLSAAVILTSMQGGRAATQKLFARTFDFRKIKDKRWIVVSAVVMPAVLILAWFVMMYLGYPLPKVTIAVASIPIMVLIYFLGAIGEELGWTGYLIDPLQKRMGALMASLVIGLVWGAWHIIPFYAMGRSGGWIAAQVLLAVLMRVVIVWLYNKANQSVFVAIVFHTFLNVSLSLFPNQGSHYNPAITACVFAVGLVVVGLIGYVKSRQAA